MSLTSDDFLVCLGITISRTGLLAIVAVLLLFTLRHLDAAFPNTYSGTEALVCYTRLQGNLQANLCLRVEGSCRHLSLTVKYMLKLRPLSQTIDIPSLGEVTAGPRKTKHVIRGVKKVIPDLTGEKSVIPDDTGGLTG